MEIVKRSPDFGKEVLRNIEVILNEIFKFYKSNINSLSKKTNQFWFKLLFTSYFLTFSFLDKLLMLHS